VSLPLFRNEMKLKIQQTERGRMLNIWKESYSIWKSRMETFFPCCFDLGIVKSLIRISVLHLENSNINVRKKFKVTNLLQQHSGVMNFYILSSYHSVTISYDKKQRNGRNTHIFKQNRIALLPQTCLVSFVTFKIIIIIYYLCIWVQQYFNRKASV